MSGPFAVVLTALALLKPVPAREPAHAHLLVRIQSTVPVLVKPGGTQLATLGSTTSFGSARVLGVVGRSGHWLRVSTADLPSTRNGWVDAAQPGVAVRSTDISLVVHLRRRTLQFLRGAHVVRTIRVGIGAPASPTPVGHFAVTDKLAGSAFSPVYGCCILALSAQQTHLPAGWHGGNRIAIHGTNVPSSIGGAVSTGCLHAAAADLRYLMARVPLGAPVRITA